MYPDVLNKLIEDFKLLPGIGEKTAERLALSVVDMDEDKIKEFAKHLANANVQIGECKLCHNIADSEKCNVCSDESRNKKILCVVEDAKNVIMLEKAKCFNGLYHVLGGLISPIDGIMPDDLYIKDLLERVEKENFEEIVFALKPSIEGETTFSYICKMLEGEKVSISKIAYGLPVGTDMEYVDFLTLERAMADRKNIS